MGLFLYKQGFRVCLVLMVGTGPTTGKTVAIILGGAAGVGFLVICLLFARSLLKKRDGMSSQNFK